MKRSFLASLIVGGILAVGGNAHASLVTALPGIPAPQSTIDFSAFTGGWFFSAGPVQIGAPVGQNIEWSTDNSTNQGGSVIGDGGYGLAGNGNWDAGRLGFTGLNWSTGTMTFMFNTAQVAAVGGFMNYAPSSAPDVIISAFDSSNNLLESYDLSTLAPISTPGGTNAGAFRGIARPTADIKSFTVSNQYVVVDDLTFSPTGSVSSVPEASSVLLMLGGGLPFAGIALRRRTRK